MFAETLLGLVVPVGFLVLVVVGIVRLVRRRDAVDAGRGGHSSVRAFFQYGLLITSLAVAMSGLGGLVANALSRLTVESLATRSTVATPLALFVVGAPVFCVLAIWVWRRLTDDAAERGRVAWSLYLLVVTSSALIAAMAGAIGTGASLVTNEPFEPSALTAALIGSGVLAAHWWAYGRVPPRRGRALPVLAGSWIGLLTSASAAVTIGYLAFQAIYGSLASTVVSRTGNTLAVAVVSLGVGVAVWAWMWVANASRRTHSNAWNVYVVLFAILPASVTALVGAGGLAFPVFEFLLGEGAGSVAGQFEDVPVFASLLMVGGGVWAYHKMVLLGDSATARSEIDRIYDYMFAGVGLAGLATGITIALAAAIEVLAPGGSTVAASGSRTPLVWAVTLTALGIPMWSIAWRRCARHAAADSGEAASPSRRTYLFAVFGISSVIAFGSLIVVLVAAFSALLEPGPSRDLGDLAVPIALLTTTGLVGSYHLTVLRRERGASATSRGPSYVVLLAGDPDTGPALASRIGGRVQMLRRLDGNGRADFNVDELVEALADTPHERVLVLAGDGGVSVVPYE